MVPDKWACVCVAFDAMAFQQHDPIPSGLVIAVTEIGDKAAPGLLYSSPFLFFLCTFSIGAFRAFFEAISALSQIVPRLALVFRFFLSSRLSQVFSGPFTRF